ncbi:Hypothetical protein I5071_73320 [Sandaracinus amylolyticus]|nr:Hypothetical protein I5071_73320 [Sandaracinus amylolyticus]
MTALLAVAATLLYGPYTDGIRVQARIAMALARELRNARPRNVREKEREALEAILEQAQVIDDIIKTEKDVQTIREQFIAFGQCWGGMHDALVAKTRLPAGVTASSATATRILEKAFPEGIAFIRFEAPAAWGEGNRRLQHIVELKLDREIDACVGVDYFTAARDATAALGEAIGTGERPRVRSSRPSKKDALFVFSRAISKYARLLSAEVDETDAESIERFQKAVAPIDTYRSTRTAREEEDEEQEEQPATPVAPIPTPGPIGDGPFVDDRES